MKEKRQIPLFQPFEFTAFNGTGEGSRLYSMAGNGFLPATHYLIYTLALHF